MVVLSCEGVACFPAWSDAFCEYTVVSGAQVIAQLEEKIKRWKQPQECLWRRGAACQTGVQALCCPPPPHHPIHRHAGDPPSTAASVMKVSGPDAASVASPVMFISLVPLVLSRPLPLPPPFSSADQYRRHTGSLSDRVSIQHTILPLSRKALPSTRLIVARLIVSQS